MKLVDRVYHNVEFYRKKMQAVGLEPGDIRGIEDLDKLPFTTKDDLRGDLSFGLFAVPNSQIVRIHAFPAAPPASPRWWVTPPGHRRVERVRCPLYQYGRAWQKRHYPGGLRLRPVHRGPGGPLRAEKMGATVVPMSTGNTKKLINMMIDFGVTGIMCTPLLPAAHRGDHRGDGRAGSDQVKTSLNGAEPVDGEDGHKIEEKLGHRGPRYLWP